MAAVTAIASPTPFAASYNDPLRQRRYEAHRAGIYRPTIRRGAPLASSVNNPPLRQPWNFSMADSSDDEVPVPPMKFSAEVKSLLGDEASAGSSPSSKKDEHKPILRLDKNKRRMSPLAVSERLRERQASPAWRNGSPRIVRLSPTNLPSSTLRKTTLIDENVIAEPENMASLVTPAPRSRSARTATPEISSPKRSSSERRRYESAETPGMGAESRGLTSSGEHSGVYEAERQMGSLSISRSRAEEMGTQTSKRQARPQITGQLLKCKARRAVKRRQSDEELSPNVEGLPSSQESHRSRVAEAQPVAQENIAEDERYGLPEADKVSKDDQEHVPIRDSRSIQAGGSRRYSDIQAEEPNRPTQSNSPEKAVHPISTINSARDVIHPTFKVPPMPLLPSRHDQENEPPPTFKRNKRDAQGDRGILSVVPDEKMLVQTPATITPSRQPLAVRSKNTPLRPAPPPPKMSVLDTVTATTGAASVAHKKKRNFMTVNKMMYTRMECLGRGGSSKVYRVMSDSFKVMALKRVTLEDQDELAIRGYKGEIDLLQQLKNVDRVIQLYDFEINEEKKILSVLMEAGEVDLAGMFSKRLIGEDARFDITWTRYFWKEMLECVSAVHAVNIVHSDLKPANFLLLRGQLKLIDFGISNAIADDTINVHREQLVGTPNYMSPEALIDSNAAAGLPSSSGKVMKIGKPSDVWSLGCILYQMVYGKPPFAHFPNQLQRVMAISSPRHAIDFPAMGIGAVPVPAGLLLTLKKCLERNQILRPTVDDLLAVNDPFLNPDIPLGSTPTIASRAGETVTVDRVLLERLQHNILKHVQEHGMPSEEEVKIWPEKFFRSIKAAVEQGRA